MTVVALLGLVVLWRGDRRAPQSPDEPEAERDAAEPREETATARPAEDAVEVGGTLPGVLVDPSVSVSKATRTLTVMSDGRPAKTYRIVLGPEPAGDKEREGDLRTPEGDFYVCTKNAQSRYHRAMGLSYPDEADAQRGLDDGIITKRQYNDIVKAIHQMKQPPWNTRLGGEIMIHGGGTHADWTEGCIALSDEDAEELFDALPLGTEVRIRP